jgi:glutamate racemase
MEALLRSLLAPHVGKLGAVVLGGTHYPLAAKAISRVLGENVVLLDGGEGTARETQRRLAQAGLLYEGPGEILWQNSAENDDIRALCRTLLNQ